MIIVWRGKKKKPVMGTVEGRVWLGGTCFKQGDQGRHLEIQWRPEGEKPAQKRAREGIFRMAEPCGRCLRNMPGGEQRPK